MTAAMTAIIVAVIFHRIGFVDAHRTVAHECKTLGAFYVGKEVFKCIEITAKEAP